MKNQKLSIGQMAKLNGISVQTMRYYEKRRLITPAETDPNTGYRYYHIEQTCTLDIIKYLKTIGLSLEEIEHFLHTEQPDTQATITRLRAKMEDIHSAIADLHFQKKAIERVIHCLETSTATPQIGAIVLESLPTRYALVHQGSIDYYENTLSYEQGLLALKAKMREYDIPYFYSLNPGAITRMERLRPEALYCNELFVYIDQPYSDCKVPITQIPGGIYLCIYCDDVLHEKQYVERLLRYIQAHRLIITGDCIQDCINDLIAIHNNRKHLLMRIGIPVRLPEIHV